MHGKVWFIADWMAGHWSKSDLCRSYGVSHPTGDKWIERY